MSRKKRDEKPSRSSKSQPKSAPKSEETFTCPKCGASIPESRYVGHLNMHYTAGA